MTSSGTDSERKNSSKKLKIKPAKNQIDISNVNIKEIYAIYKKQLSQYAKTTSIENKFAMLMQIRHT